MWLIISVNLLDMVDHVFESWPLARGNSDQVLGDKLDGDLSVRFAVGTYLEFGATIVLDEFFNEANGFVDTVFLWIQHY